jgi:single-strand DNA-binding protein
MSTPISIVGNVTSDPDLRFTNGGKPVASFTVAVNSRRKDDNGGWVDGNTSFYRVSCWDTLAEHAAASLTKGTRVVVAGRLEMDEYVDKDGNKRVSASVTADDIGPSLRWATATIEKVERT